MNPAYVMAEVAAVLEGLPKIRKAYPHPVKSLAGGVPAVVVGYPRIEFNAESVGAGMRGTHRLEIPVALVIGGVVERESATLFGRYAGTGTDYSVLDALAAATWATCDYVAATVGEQDVFTAGSVDYQTVMFTVDAVVSDE